MSQADFTSLLNQAMSDALHYGTLYYWTIFLMLPKCLLVRPSLSPGSSLAKLISSRILSWKNREYATLWSAVSSDPPSDSHNPLSAAKSYASVGEYSKAVAALVPSTRKAPDDSSALELQSKHPRGPKVVTKLLNPKQLVIPQDYS
jgi:hypothetical protein